MSRKATAAVLLAFTSLVIGGTAIAQTAPSPKSGVLDGMQSAVIKSIGAQDKTVEITMADGVLTVLRVNSNQNALSHAGRNNEATAISVIASKAMNEDATAAGVHTIRVQYLTRDSAHPEGTVIDNIEFRKNSKGAFEMHVT